jgi:hypothetical protein
VVPEVTNWGLKVSGFPSLQYTSPEGNCALPQADSIKTEQHHKVSHHGRIMNRLIGFIILISALKSYFNSGKPKGAIAIFFLCLTLCPTSYIF